MDYTYEIPGNVKQTLVAALKANGFTKMSDVIAMCQINFIDVGYAYYAGLNGDVWDKHAIDCVLNIPEEHCQYIVSCKKTLSQWIDAVMPTNSGLLCRNITVIPLIVDIGVELPQITADNWETLYKDIIQAISRNEPTLVIDRLNTFTVIYLNSFCQDKGIAVKNDRDESYPIHSLMGSLSKHYSENENIQSELSKQALKMSISLFEKYNDLRNKKSYAHDNEILSNAEACYAIRMVSATICFLHEIERDLLI